MFFSSTSIDVHFFVHVIDLTFTLHTVNHFMEGWFRTQTSLSS